MRYRNSKTGAVIDVSSKLRGLWVPVEGQAPASAEKKETKTVTAKKTNNRKKQ